MDRGVVLNELERFGVEEIDLDEPGPGEATVRIEATGVCHSDLHVIRTGFGHPMPVLLGHEGAGVVEAVGEGVEHVREGVAGANAERLISAARRPWPPGGCTPGTAATSRERFGPGPLRRAP
jgi:NADPH:quinone reductase-like Zn-dependent oxidoreductase